MTGGHPGAQLPKRGPTESTRGKQPAVAGCQRFSILMPFARLPAITALMHAVRRLDGRCAICWQRVIHYPVAAGSEQHLEPQAGHESVAVLAAGRDDVLQVGLNRHERAEVRPVE